MEIFGRAAAALARRAARTMQLGGAVIFGAAERDQHVIAQSTEGREPAASLQHFERAGKQRMEALRFGSNISRTWLSLGICSIPNSVWQFERPCPYPSAKCR